MSSLFVRVALASVFLFSSAFAVFAQETAALPPIDTISMQPTVDLCEIGDGEDGTCVNPTQAYMGALVAQALPAEQFS